MNEKFTMWMQTAKWWHFWNPGSSFGGGCITGLIIVAIFITWSNV